MALSKQNLLACISEVIGCTMNDSYSVSSTESRLFFSLASGELYFKYGEINFYSGGAR
jgi:hypothetical protein